MSAWKEKKEQQIIFDGVVTTPSNNVSLQSAISQNDDGYIFLQKVINYGKKVSRGSIIIDIGCGTGALINEISQKFPNIHYLIGIDLSSQSIKIAKQKNEEADFIICDMDVLPLRDKVCDMLILRNVLHHSSTLKPLGNAIDLLNSNGLMLIDDKIRGNPLQEILVLLYPLIPYNFKMFLRENAAHIDCYGNLPPIKYRNAREYVNFIEQHSNGLIILEVNYHGVFLFLGFLSVLYHFFPRLSNIHIPFYKLYSLEKRRILRWAAVSMTIVVERV